MLVQLELPFDELKAEKVDADTLPFFPEPKNDNERLMNFQHEYYRGNESALNDIYKTGYEVAYKMINQTVCENKHVKGLSLEQRAEKAHQAITYIIEQYLKKDCFVIKTSMTAYIYLRVKHELFYKRKCDNLVQFVDWNTFRDKEL